VRMISVRRKISTIEQWRKDQNWLLRREDYRSKAHKLEKTALGLDPVKVFLYHGKLRPNGDKL
jgi:hypothetical protein